MEVGYPLRERKVEIRGGHAEEARVEGEEAHGECIIQERAERRFIARAGFG